MAGRSACGLPGACERSEAERWSLRSLFLFLLLLWLDTTPDVLWRNVGAILLSVFPGYRLFTQRSILVGLRKGGGEGLMAPGARGMVH